MSRKLFVCSDISVDEAIADISDEDPVSALLWPWLLVHLDDWGRSSASTRRLKASIAPMMQAITPDVIGAALDRYAARHLIAIYEVDGHQYLAVNPEKWWRYQTHIHKSKRDDDQSAIPAPPRDAFETHRGESRKIAELRDGSQEFRASPHHSSPLFSTPPPTPPRGGGSKKESGSTADDLTAWSREHVMFWIEREDGPGLAEGDRGFFARMLTTYGETILRDDLGYLANYASGHAVKDPRAFLEARLKKAHPQGERIGSTECPVPDHTDEEWAEIRKAGIQALKEAVAQ